MKRLFLTTALIFAGMSASAQTSIHTCTIQADGTRGWVASEMVLAIPGDNRPVLVSDPFVQRYEGAPKEVRWNAARNTASWSVTMRSSRGQNMRVRYRAELLNSGQNVRVLVNLPTRQRHVAVGTCKTQLQG